MAEAVIVALVSLPAFWVAAAFGPWWIAPLAAAIVAVLFVATAAIANARPLPEVATLSDVTPSAARAAINAAFMGVAFLWGGAAIAIGYGLTDLYWQHWWQYAAAMALLGAVALSYASLLPRPGSQWADPTWLSRMTRLALGQGVAAAIGLAFLISSGKLTAGKPDWLANQVFLFGGLAIIGLSAIAVRAQWRGGEPSA